MSPTAINTYLQCPHKYYLRYIRRLPGKPSIHLIRGNLVHRAIEKFHQESRSGKKQQSLYATADRLLTIFSHEWNQAQDRINKLGMPPAIVDDFYRQSRLMLLNLAQWLHDHQAHPPQKTEARLFSQNLGLMGIVDAVYETNSGPILVDYKTSKNPQITPDMKRQAGFYALLFQDLHHKSVQRVLIHFLVSQEEPQAIFANHKLLKDCLNTMERVFQKTRSQDELDYPCTCGGYCQRDFIFNSK